jgi:hypothetical protein
VDQSSNFEIESSFLFGIELFNCYFSSILIYDKYSKIKDIERVMIFILANCLQVVIHLFFILLAPFVVNVGFMLLLFGTHCLLLFDNIISFYLDSYIELLQ